jgi:hypothetical protein
MHRLTEALLTSTTPQRLHAPRKYEVRACSALSKSCMSLNSASSQSLDSLSGVDADSALLTPVRGPPRTRDTYSRGG